MERNCHGRCVVFAPDGQHVIVSFKKGKEGASIWNVCSGEKVRRLTRQVKPTSSANATLVNSESASHVNEVFAYCA